MKKRRILTVLTAAAMTFAMTTTAFAADDLTQSVGDGGTTLPGDTTVSGSGTMEYAKLDDKYSVTLPTSAALNFTLDPQGLATLENGKSADMDTLLEKGGNIVTADTAGAYIKNESSARLKVTVKAKITDDNDTKVTAKNTLNGVKGDGDTGTNICLVAVPGKNAKPADISGHVDAAKGIVIDKVDGTDTTDFSYVLDKAEYEVQKDDSGAVSLEKKTGTDNYDAATFKLMGTVNPAADWSAYTATGGKHLGVNAVFNIAKAGDTETSDNSLGYGLMTPGNDVTLVALPEKDQAPSIANTTISVTSGQAFDVPVDYGKGNLAATGITKVESPVTHPGTNLLDTPYASVSGNTITFTADAATFMKTNNVSSLKIVFNDTAGTEKTITIR